MVVGVVVEVVVVVVVVCVSVVAFAFAAVLFAVVGVVVGVVHVAIAGLDAIGVEGCVFAGLLTTVRHARAMHCLMAGVLPTSVVIFFHTFLFPANAHTSAYVISSGRSM